MTATIETTLRALAQRVTASAEEARALPPAAYLSEDLYQLELDRLFRGDWICLGREEEIQSPGEYFTIELAGEPLLILRDHGGALHALSNVCRHRYMQIADGKGVAARLTCPYHGWTYNLDGTLAGAPHMMESRVFDRNSCRLPEFRIETWLGFIFVNLDGNAPPLADGLHDLGERLRPYRIEEMRISAMYDEVWRGNWKLTMENNAEAYHHFNLHGQTLEPWMPARRSYCGAATARWAELRSPLEVERLARDAPTYARLIERWGADVAPADRAETLTYVLFPSATIDASPGICFWKRILPIDIAHTRVMMGALVPASEHCETLTRENTEFFATLNPEDHQATWKLQKTVGSRYATPGPLSAKESCLHHFHRYLAHRLCA